MNISSRSGRPKTRNQWSCFYAEFNEEKKRIRSKISESGSSSERVEKPDFKKMKSQSKTTVPTPALDEDDVVLIVEEDETSDEEYSKEDNNKNTNQIRFLDDDVEEEDGVLIREEDVGLMEEDDETIDDDLQEKEKAMEKKKKQKKEQRGRDISFEFWEASDDPSLAPPKQGAKKTVEEKQKGKGIPRKKTALKEDGRHGGVKRTKEDQKRKEKEKGGHGKRSEKKSGNESEEDEVVFLGTGFSGSGAGLNTGSVSGSKVGSVGGMSSDIVTYDEFEVASSTSKKINESAGVVSSEDSDASSLESEDSEKDDDSDEDDDTSDTSYSNDDSEDDDDEDETDAGGKQEPGVCSRLRSQANPKKEENQNGEKASSLSKDSPQPEADRRSWEQHRKLEKLKQG